MADVLVSSSRTATTVPAVDTAVVGVLPGLRWHQIDAGNATTGTLAVNCDFGCGARVITTIDFAESDRVPVLVFGDIKAITLVPTTVGSSYTVAYIATEV